MARRPGIRIGGRERLRLRPGLWQTGSGSMKQLALGMRLRADAVFESFAAGQNFEILAALRSANPTPLWLWGAHGSGKTHLLQAVCADAGMSAAYFPLNRSLALPPGAL